MNSTVAIEGALGMLVRFWGTRGSLPVAPRARAIEDKLVGALMKASGRRFESEAEARGFVNAELAFGEGHTYGGATTCLEIEGADDSFFIVDMGSGLRELGNDAFERRDHFGFVDVRSRELEVQLERFGRRPVVEHEGFRPSHLGLRGHLAGLFARHRFDFRRGRQYLSPP